MRERRVNISFTLFLRLQSRYRKNIIVGLAMRTRLAYFLKSYRNLERSREKQGARKRQWGFGGKNINELNQDINKNSEISAPFSRLSGVCCIGLSVWRFLRLYTSQSDGSSTGCVERNVEEPLGRRYRAWNLTSTNSINNCQSYTQAIPFIKWELGIAVDESFCVYLRGLRVLRRWIEGRSDFTYWQRQYI